jgi:hypothetical protein
MDGKLQKMNGKMIEELLRGSFDLHVHASPDLQVRKFNVVQLAKEESKYGIRGVVVKSQHVPTYIHAKIVNDLNLGGTTLYGGIPLNYTACGYLNEEIVETALRMGAKVIWMPTISAAHHLKVFGADPSKGITIVDEEGKLILEVRKIIKLAIDFNSVLATGHISPSETKALVKEATSLGLKKIVVTHPESPIINMSIEDQIELTNEYKVYVEYCALSLYTPKALKNLEDRLNTDEIVNQIKALNPEHVIISTDFGQVEFPSPVDGMKKFIKELHKRGVSKDDILKMIRKNPSRLVEK